jgi:hypothetical protein
MRCVLESHFERHRSTQDEAARARGLDVDEREMWKALQENLADDAHFGAGQMEAGTGVASETECELATGVAIQIEAVRIFEHAGVMIRPGDCE